MSRVELTQNLGPEVIYSWDQTCANTCYSNVVNVRLYTLHSYQVVNTGGGVVQITILGSNHAEPNKDPDHELFDVSWSEIAQYNVPANDSIAYSDFWNFKFSCVKIVNANTGLTPQILIAEKHNA